MQREQRDHSVTAQAWLVGRRCNRNPAHAEVTMKRSGPIKRARMKRKPRRNGNPAIVREWRNLHESCACCWNHWRTFGVVLEAHHMLGGRFGKPDATWNMLMLDRECHARLGHGRDNLAIC